jgi:outer membrane beta-barrel protein
MIKRGVKGIALTALFLAGVTPVFAATSGEYQRAGDGTEVVLRKTYPKKSRIEIEGTGGLVLNQSYTNTMLFGAGVNYFWSEEWGVGVEAMMASNTDKSERECLENFYNDPENVVSAECGDGSDLTGRANFGPAYVPVRQTNTLLGAHAIWNPVYGKQIILLRAVTHFDLYVLAGGGLAMSTFWKQQTQLRGTSRSNRGTFNADTTVATGNPGAAVSENGLYGKEGRPDPESLTSIQGTFAVGQKYHFTKNLHARIELRDYLLLGTASGFDNFFALTGGLGFRF